MGYYTSWACMLFISITLCAGTLTAANPSSPRYHTLPSLRQQAALYDGWRAERLEAIPALLQKHNVSAWILSQREYAEDTVFWSMKPSTSFSARRRTVSAFFANPPRRSSTKSNRTSYSWIDNTPRVWAELRQVLEAHEPATIALNIDAEVSFSSGLHAGEFELFKEQLGMPWKERFVSKPIIAVEYVATLPKAQFVWYQKLMETAWAMISEAFSEKVITPGKTTTEDVEWWLRDKIQAMNYTTWFHGAVSVLTPETEISPASGMLASTIQYGDLLHVDFGVTALGMNTDTQHLAYVLRPGETEDSPTLQSYQSGLHIGNRMQDIVRNNMLPGLTGNEVLRKSLQEMRLAGIKGRVYCHPIGDWGHSAGGVIGMTNLPDFVPVIGDLPVLNSTYYSIELYAEHYVPEKNATIKFLLEEDVYWECKTHSWEWVFGRQKKLHLIGSSEDRSNDVFKVQA